MLFSLALFLHPMLVSLSSHAGISLSLPPSLSLLLSPSYPLSVSPPSLFPPPISLFPPHLSLPPISLSSVSLFPPLSIPPRWPLSVFPLSLPPPPPRWSLSVLPLSLPSLSPPSAAASDSTLFYDPISHSRPRCHLLGRQSERAVCTCVSVWDCAFVCERD
ncbi:unnamed protein product [Boreogadus saida]